MKKDVDQFRFDLPDGWQDQTVYHFRGPVIDDREHLLTLVIDRHLRQTDVREFARPRTRPVLEALQGVEVLKDEETTAPGCYPSYEFVYRWMPAEDMKIFKKQIFVLRESRGYSFEIAFSKKSYKMLDDQIKKVIESLLPGTYKPREDR